MEVERKVTLRTAAGTDAYVLTLGDEGLRIAQVGIHLKPPAIDPGQVVDALDALAIAPKMTGAMAMGQMIEQS